MLTASRSMSFSARSTPELPRIAAFRDLYSAGIKPRRGQVIMIAGRSGSQKSGLALFWVETMGLPTLYFSADMRASTASSRLLGVRMGLAGDKVDDILANDPEAAAWCLENLAGSRVQFCFDSPITWHGIEAELDAHVEVYNKFPEVMVFDNLMDFDGADADYAEQMRVMQLLTELARETDATVIILHHASDKTLDAKANPWAPPSRDQVKGGLSEKPELSLSVALDPTTNIFRIACIKQREGKSDPTASSPVMLRSKPEKTQFAALDIMGA